MSPNQFYILCFLLLGIVACNPSANKEPKEIDPFEAAMPHGAALPSQQLTKKEKEKLASAKGRSVQNISIEDLSTIVNENDPKLRIYNFWKIGCSECLNLNQQLQKIEHNKEDKLELILINVDSKAKVNLVNTYIREHNITAKVFQIDINTANGDLNNVFDKWNNQLPFFYLKNNTDGIDLNYQKNFTDDELISLLEPLLL